MTMTELDQELERLRGSVLFDARPVRALYRAALARAEAAEAEAVDLHRQLAEMAAAMEEIEAERLALAARVAELEAQLAAQQWIEVDDDPDMYNWYLTYNAEAEDLDNIGMNVSFYDGTWEHECTHYRPLPPAPQEPTQ